MLFKQLNWAAIGPTVLFVLLWSAGAIFSKWGLEHASAFAFLLLRFALACVALGLLALTRRRWLPQPGTRRQVALVGVLMTGGYTIFYLLSLDAGLTPGVLATVLGVQPILTLMLLERRASGLRVAGLLLALGGLTLVVLDSLLAARFSLLGIGLSLAALLCITVGSIFQKGIQQSPMDVLPLQYALGLLMCALVAPFQPFEVEWSVGFVVPLFYMGVLISVGATLLLYRLIRMGNLVNVTSLFYLMPGTTALLDYLFLGNRMALGSLLGMGLIVVGLVLVFRQRV
ncbi:DMT family transporter [Pseudomonas neustonica]|mgnify:FL=1|uniref:DMT family transporter n=1 Tax=Pseudomonas TaxID=286 RepID=UPI0015F3B966|nr:DMT family transporter [Pseudomonas sp. 5Ae-yellow]MBA6421881.1 DMT family transporter [Pseudomonas sp. 5Ae-yellow]|tara:strand:+ start:474 stop:1331 length:858 start_codon:yes stop_codon:yes gene_type:complete